MNIRSSLVSVLLLALLTSAVARKHRRRGPNDLRPKHVLPADRQVSAFLRAATHKRFLYRSLEEGEPISLVITPCSSVLNGDITFFPSQIRDGDQGGLVVRRLNTSEQVVYTERRGEPGAYHINITAVSDTYVHFLAAKQDLAGLSSLQTSVRVHKEPKGRAKIRWTASSHAGESLKYCLIVSPSSHFSTICGAVSAKFGVDTPLESVERRRRHQAAPLSRRRQQHLLDDGNITVGCVGKATEYWLHDLVPGAKYYVTVFGGYGRQGVSFQYGVTAFRYADVSERPLPIRQNRVTEFRLTPARRRQLLRLRPRRRHRRRSHSGRPIGRQLHFYAASCGGDVTMSVFRGRRTPVLIQQGEIANLDYSNSRLTNVTRGWYQFQFQGHERPTSVEFYATWNPRKVRLARLPDAPLVSDVTRRVLAEQNVTGADACGVLHLKMERSRGRKLEYCVILEADTSGRRSRQFRAPSVCGLDWRLEQARENIPDLVQCATTKQLKDGKYIRVNFTSVQPGSSYIVRAMVRPHKGRFLPYHLKQVTVPNCPSELPNELTELDWTPANERSEGAELPAEFKEAAEEAANQLAAPS